MSDGVVETPAPTMLKRLWRTALVAGMVLLPLVGAAAVLVLRAPAWWNPVPRADANAADRAAAFEQGIVAEFTKVRGDAVDWAIRIRESDVNDWLGTRLPAWMESRGEPVPTGAQARMQADAVAVGVHTGMVVAWWQARLAAQDGGVRLQDERGGLGRLPVPGVTFALDAGLNQAALERPIRLADGRIVRILDVETLPGEVRLRLRTEPASK
jgi:hypothetical protein